MSLNYGKHEISDIDIEAVVEVLRSGPLTQGEVVPKFEQAVCQHVGAKYGVAVNSATAALHSACLALGLGSGDIMWTVPNTFVSTANCGLMCGAEVDFVDIDVGTLNLCPNNLEEKLVKAAKLNKLPKVIISVHFGGLPADQSKLYELKQKYGFKIIEDASHSIGSSIFGVKTGSCKWSDVTVFSFHPVKIITSGEGGMALTNCPVIDKALRLYRTHGITRDFNDYDTKMSRDWYYEQKVLGYNYRMSDIHASLGLSQLSKLDGNLVARNRIAKTYTNCLSSLPLKIQIIPKGFYSSYHLYVIAPKEAVSPSDAEVIFDRLREARIQAARHYYPVHLQPFYQKLGFRRGYCPVAELHGFTSISLPIFPALLENDQSRVLEVIHTHFDDC